MIRAVAIRVDSPQHPLLGAPLEGAGPVSAPAPLDALTLGAESALAGEPLDPFEPASGEAVNVSRGAGTPRARLTLPQGDVRDAEAFEAVQGEYRERTWPALRDAVFADDLEGVDHLDPLEVRARVDGMASRVDATFDAIARIPDRQAFLRGTAAADLLRLTEAYVEELGARVPEFDDPQGPWFALAENGSALHPSVYDVVDPEHCPDLADYDRARFFTPVFPAQLESPDPVVALRNVLPGGPELPRLFRASAPDFGWRSASLEGVPVIHPRNIARDLTHRHPGARDEEIALEVEAVAANVLAHAEFAKLFGEVPDNVEPFHRAAAAFEPPVDAALLDYVPVNELVSDAVAAQLRGDPVATALEEGRSPELALTRELATRQLAAAGVDINVLSLDGDLRRTLLDAVAEGDRVRYRDFIRGFQRYLIDAARTLVEAGQLRVAELNAERAQQQV